jgi:TPR repeat protein
MKYPQPSKSEVDALYKPEQRSITVESDFLARPARPHSPMYTEAIQSTLAKPLVDPLLLPLTEACQELDEAAVVAYCQDEAIRGHAIAQFNVGLCYLRGRGVNKGHRMALKYFRLASQQNVGEASLQIGKCFYKGEGEKQDLREALKCFELAADAGVTEAQSILGWLHMNGEGVSTNYPGATKLLRLAADKHDLDAQTNLATCLACGLGVRKNEVEAAQTCS